MHTPRPHPLARWSNALTVALALAFPLAAAPHRSEPSGALLVPGSYAEGVGETTSSGLPSRKASQWPTDQWYELSWQGNTARLRAVPSHRAKAEFIDAIMKAQAAAQETDVLTHRYIRVPGLTLKEGPLAPYIFKNGSAQLTPILEHRYQLVVGGAPVTFSVHNGLRNAQGVAYGGGTRYRISDGGADYEYDLGGYGWDTRIELLADFDGDGKPDFLIYVGGSNHSLWHLLLSSQAQPGVNRPTATAHQIGC